MSDLQVGTIGLGEVVLLMHLPALDRLHDRFAVTGVTGVSPSAFIPRLQPGHLA